ncbi:MAG: GH25 family lysozyme [archaeon]|nr:GH25 family lysozyme [archaeon]
MQAALPSFLVCFAKMKIVASLLVLATLFAAASAYSGVDISQLTSTGSFQCLVSNGYHFTVVRAYQSNGVPDPNCPASVANAWAGGMSYVDVYFFPCPTCSASAGSQIDQAVQALRNSNVKFGQFWLDIEGTQYWTGSQSANQAFFQGLVSAAHSNGLNLGVYTSASQWYVSLSPSFHFLLFIYIFLFFFL